MVATALISMWTSNPAVTLMMAPIAIGVANSVDQEEGATPIAIPLLLGVAYAASIGGLMTPIGSPPNLVALGFLRQQYGLDISFGPHTGTRTNLESDDEKIEVHVHPRLSYICSRSR